MVNIDGEEYLHASEAARLLQVKTATLYAYVSRGRIKRYKLGVGRHSLFKLAELEALISVQTGEAEDEIPLASSWVRER